MIFQDPFASLNPYRRLADQVAEPLVNFRLASKSEIEDRVAHLFDRVELPRSFLAVTHTNFPADSGSAWPSLGRLPPIPNSSSPTRLSRPSTFPFKRRS